MLCLSGGHQLNNNQFKDYNVQNRAIRSMYHLQCFEHVTVHYHSAKWLPFSLVKYHAVCVMFYQYHHDYGQGIPLEPPIQFGKLSKYHTRTKENFALPLRCHLSFAQSFFRNRGRVSTQNRKVLRLLFLEIFTWIYL